VAAAVATRFDNQVEPTRRGAFVVTDFIRSECSIEPTNPLNCTTPLLISTLTSAAVASPESVASSLLIWPRSLHRQWRARQCESAELHHAILGFHFDLSSFPFIVPGQRSLYSCGDPSIRATEGRYCGGAIRDRSRLICVPRTQGSF
jgi:hypothetical protein